MHEDLLDMPGCEGWIKKYRRRKHWLRSEPICNHVWNCLLEDANYERMQLKTGQYVERGQTVIGERKYAKELGIGRQQLRTTLETLERCEMITREVTHLGTIVTICNYLRYQLDPTGSKPESNPTVTHEQPTGNPRVNPKEEGNKERSKQGKKKGGSRASQFNPPSLEEVRDYCSSRSNDVDAERFYNYYASQGWKKSNGVKLSDWKRAVMNWENNGKQTKKVDLSI